jgi:hypothetical protein
MLSKLSNINTLPNPPNKPKINHGNLALVKSKIESSARKQY